MKKRLISTLLAALMTLSLVACDNSDGDKVGGKVNIPTTQTGSDDFQKNMHQSITTKFLSVAAETDDGFYVQLNGMFIYYIEKATKAITILCNKPECKHEDITCNAFFHAQALWASGDKLYYSNGDYVEENGQYVNYGERLYSADFDGTNRRTVQNLGFAPGGDTSSWIPLAMGHRGIVYFTYSGVLYAMPLGGNIEKDAVAVWGEESADAGQSLNLSAPKYTLWADGDTMYFKVNIPQTDGTYKDTLFAYDPETGEVSQVWQTPDGSEVGQWVSTGVSVSQWYVLEGYIYFYLSGNDFWRTNLETGEHEKLADTSDKTEYGTAIFSDDYLCLMNDTPEDKNGQQYGIGGNNYIGGDTIYVYGLDGTLVKEVSLKSLYGEIDGIKHCEMVFCSGNEIYFVADASAQTWSSGSGTMNWNRALCCVNIETGEITRIYNW